MKRNSFFLALVLTVFAFGLANAQVTFTEAIGGPGLYGTNDDTVATGFGSVYIDITINVGGGINTKINGYTNGFHLYSPDGGVWSTWTGSHLAAYTATANFDLTEIINDYDFMDDQSDFDDTVAFIGATLFGTGLPPGYSGESFRLEFAVADAAQAGKTFCVDSTTNFPPTNSWKWTDLSSEYFPNWGGPYCFLAFEVPDQPPFITNDPVTLSGSHCATVSHDFDWADNDGCVASTQFYIAAGPGSINATTGEYEWNPTMGDVGASNAVTIGVECPPGNSTEITVNLVATNDAPTVNNCPTTLGAQVGVDLTFDFNADSECGTDPMNWNVTGAVAGALSIDVLGVMTYNADAGDVGTQQICVIVDDGNKADTCCFDVNVSAGAPYAVTIEKDEGQTGIGALQGQFTTVDVVLEGAAGVVGGFNFLMAYDNSVLSFSTASAGAALVACDWEYFTYRVGPDGNCSGGCPSGMIRVVGIAETNNGPHHPDPACDLSGEILFSMEFLVSSDHTVNCQFAPIRFFWIECGDNTMTNADGDTLFLSQTVRDYTGLGDPLLGDYGPDLSGDSCYVGVFPTYRGHICECFIGGGIDKPAPFAAIDFKNGGVDIACVDDLDDRGDINLDGLAYTIADAVMFTNYFIYGLSVFPDIPGTTSLEGAIAATDVNADGLTLTVADLVYLIRVVVGDAAPYPKASPVAVQVTYTAEGTISVPTEMGAAYVVVEGDAAPRLLAENMTMESNFDGENTHIIVYSHEANEVFSGEFLAAGGNITYLEMATFHGAPVAHTLVPSEFSVAQNYPNPFNPRTTIQFTMPEAGDYSVKIYNITGQLVEEIAGNAGVGTHTVSWDAADNASGIYFYKVTAGEFSKTMKMVLLK